MRVRTVWVVVAVVLLATAGAFAQGGPGGPGRGPMGPMPPRGHGGPAGDPAGLLLRAADADDSRDVTAEEWTAFLGGLAVDGDDAVSLDDLAAALPAPPRGWPEDTAARDALFVRLFDRDHDGVVESADLQAIHDAAVSRPPPHGGNDDGDRPPPPHGCRPRGPALALLRAADTDGSGDVSADEWAALLAGLSVDGDGAVSLDDLAAVLPVPPEGWPTDTAERDALLLRAFDDDSDGAVTVAELEAILGRFDRDGDGAAEPREMGPPKPPHGRCLRAGMALARAADADESGDVTADEWTAFLDGLATDETGAIPLDTLAAALPAPHRGWPEDAAKRDGMLLRAYDGDGDGSVTKADLQALFDALDRDADGDLDANDRPPRR